MEGLAAIVVRGYSEGAVLPHDADGRERMKAVRRRVAEMPPLRRRAAVFFVGFSHTESALLYCYETGVGPFSQWLDPDGSVHELSPVQDTFFGMTHRVAGDGGVHVRLTAPAMAQTEYEVIEDDESGQAGVLGHLAGVRAQVRYAFARLVGGGVGRVRVVGTDAETGALVEHEMP